MKTLIISLVLLLLLLAGTITAQENSETPDSEDERGTICFDAAIPDAAPSYYIGIAEVQFARKDYNGAIFTYNCVLERQPDYAPAYASRGYAYAALGDITQALADYEQALVLDEALVAAYNNRGLLYTTQGNFGLALNDYTLALALEPDNAETYNNRGVVHAIEGGYDLALADFEQALALDPTFATPHASIAAVYSARAAQAYQAYIDTAGDNARLPAGTPDRVILDLDEALRDGNFSVWLSLLTPEG